MKNSKRFVYFSHFQEYQQTSTISYQNVTRFSLSDVAAISRFKNQSWNGRDLHSSIHSRCFLYLTSSALLGVASTGASTIEEVLSEVGADEKLLFK